MDNTSKDSSLISFKRYYETNVSSLIRFAIRFVPLEIAEDIVHDVFLEMWNHQETDKDIPSRPYLFMAVRNRCLNSLKREQIKENYIHTAQLDNQILGLDYYDSYEKRIIEQEDLQLVYDEIERLPEKCRVIFKMAYLEDRKSAEIAETLELSIRTVEHQLYLGLNTLRQRLAGKGKKHLFFLLFF